jgi:hypothetical protein
VRSILIAFCLDATWIVEVERPYDVGRVCSSSVSHLARSEDYSEDHNQPTHLKSTCKITSIPTFAQISSTFSWRARIRILVTGEAICIETIGCPLLFEPCGMKTRLLVRRQGVSLD